MSGLFIKFWESVVKKNPGLRDEQQVMTITVFSFRKQMERSFNAGREAQSEQHKTAEELMAKYGKTPFEKLFGGPL